MKLGWDTDEVRRVVRGFELADLVERQQGICGRRVVILETDGEAAVRLRDATQQNKCGHSIKVVRDRLSLQLVLRRNKPDAIVLAVDSELGQQLCRELRENAQALDGIRWVSIYGENQEVWGHWDAVLHRPYEVSSLFEVLKAIFEETQESACVTTD